MDAGSLFDDGRWGVAGIKQNVPAGSNRAYNARTSICVTDWEKAGLPAPEQGERHSFEIAMAKKGPKAINQRPVL